jgi:hypothetical protein
MISLLCIAALGLAIALVIIGGGDDQEPPTGGPFCFA